MKRFRSIVSVVVIAMCIAFWAPALWAQQADARINLNTATAEELAALKHVGPKLSQRIVEYREAEGLFAAAEDIMRVPGIGQRVYEVNKELITVE